MTRNPPARTRNTPTTTRRGFQARRLGAALITVLAVGAVIAVNAPTVGATAAGWYHQYQITRTGYEAKYGRWVKLDIPTKFRVNGIHSTLLYNGDVLIMAGSGNNQSYFDAGTFKTLLLNPVTMQEKLIPTPWDIFCAGHVELPDGNILLAGGTARYENLKPVYPAGSMTVINTDRARSRTVPKGTVFVNAQGQRFASDMAITVPAATKQGAGQQNVWVDALRKGKSSLAANEEHYRIGGRTGALAGHRVYGVGSPMTLQQQNFQGTDDAYIYDVKQERFVKVSSMNYARWYPTLAELGNGMDMAMSGLDNTGNIAMTSESFNPATKAWTKGPSHGFPTYPATFLTENGRLFFTGSSAGYGPATAAWRTPGFWNIKTNAFRPVGGMPDAKDLETSASVLLPPAQKQTVMVMGGGGVGQSASATARTALLDMSAVNPAWVRGPDLAQKTRYPISVLLPDDNVLVTGGSRYYRGMHGSDNRDTRVYHPSSNSFSWAANSSTGRDYHSGGILLPDGSVLTLGGNPLYGDKQDTTPQTFNTEIDVYFPPYMFQGGRPAIESAPKIMALGHSYVIKVSQAESIRDLRLMRPDNPTHVTDVNQRSVAVGFTRIGHGELRITLPSNDNLVPPSYYMLFAANAKGVPSAAYWVRVP